MVACKLFVFSIFIVSSSCSVLSKTNPMREEKTAAIERAAAVALCQSAKGFDCWRFAKAPTAGQITQIKIYGERQSGARFLKQLVGLNLDVDVVSLEETTRHLLPHEVDKLYKKDFSNSFGWRHSCAPTQDQFDKLVEPEVLQRTLFLCVAKNPYAWLLSLYSKLPRYRGSIAEKVTFEEFTQTPWVALGRENIDSCQRKLASKAESSAAKQRDVEGFLNPIVLWNQKNRALRRLKAPYVLFVRYEDVLLDPSDFLQQLVTKFGLRRKAAFLINVLQPTTLSGVRRQKQGGALAQNRTFDSFRQYYLYGGWQKRFREVGALERLRFVHRWLDHDTLNLWGYALWPADDPLGPGGAGLGAAAAAALAHPGGLHRPVGIAGSGGGVAGYAQQHHLHPQKGSRFPLSKTGQETSSGDLRGSAGNDGDGSRNWRVGGSSSDLVEGGRLKRAREQIRDEALAALDARSLPNGDASLDGALPSSANSKQQEVKKPGLCDPSNGPAKKRDRERCARRERLKQALLGVKKEVAVVAATAGHPPTVSSPSAGGGEAGEAGAAISKYVEAAALSAASSAGASRGGKP